MGNKKIAAVRKKSNAIPWFIIGIILVMVAMGAIFALDGSKTPEAVSKNPPSVVSVEEAYQLRQKGAFMLDVRRLDEWEQGHIPGATLITLDELSTRLDEVPRDQPVVVVCRSGNRSAQGRDILLEAGFTQVTSMDGGMISWQALEYETITGK